MKDDGRYVWLIHEHVQGEVVTQHLHGAKVKYMLGGFEWTEDFTDEDYREYFEYGEED